MTRYISIIILIAANLWPLYGVFFAGWNALELLLLYWVESGVIGLVNLWKIERAEGTEIASGLSGYKVNGHGIQNPRDRSQVKRFFIAHYGVFMLAHLFFIGFFISIGLSDGKEAISFGRDAREIASHWQSALVAILGLGISHSYSYWANYIGREEYKIFSPSQQMMRPYGRIMIMHMTVILGAFGLKSAGIESLSMLIVLVGMKLLADVYAHVKEHRGFPDIPVSMEVR